MKVLVTGAAGFIGFHVSQYLINRGDQVVGLDNLNDFYDCVQNPGNARFNICFEFYFLMAGLSFMILILFMRVKVLWKKSLKLLKQLMVLFLFLLLVLNMLL